MMACSLHWAAVGHVAPRSHEEGEEEDPCYREPHSGHQERRQRLDGDADSKVGAAPDQVDGGKRQDDGAPGGLWVIAHRRAGVGNGL